jgi:3-oxoacyl-[acyl-carrier-protein] synthase II
VRRRVFVNGVGAFTALGATWPQARDALAAGASAVRPVRAFDATGFPSSHAAAIDQVPLEGRDRRLALALPAAREAWDAAGVEGTPAERIGVFVGAETGRPSFETLVQLARESTRGQGLDEIRLIEALRSRASVLDPREVSPAAVAFRLAAEFKARGPCATVSLACASGAAAVIEAARSLRAGECDVALCGGVGADVDPLLLAAFGLLGALSPSGISRPFDRRRDGFVLGEGAAMAVLSCRPSPVELAGVGRALDAHHITAPAPDGRGAERAMRLALADAGRSSVDVVQAHGTSTQLNDAIEARALQAVLGERLGAARVSSVKGALGHTIAAAGALGLLAAAEAVGAGTVLPTAGLEEPDPDCSLPHVLGRAIALRVESALVNAFAFGGANCSLVLARSA